MALPKLYCACKSPGDLVKMQILIMKFWVRWRFLGSKQVPRESHFEDLRTLIRVNESEPSPLLHE